LFHHDLRLWGETTEATDDDNAQARPPAAGRRRGYHHRSGTARTLDTPQPRQLHRPAVRGPSGPIGHLVTRKLARGNASFNRWLVHELATRVPPPATVLEVGCGPGIALRELLTAYPDASVAGVDRSPVVLKSARRRNALAIAGGRLTLVTGGIEKAVGYAPADLVLACHVLYFWADPVKELRRVREVLAPGGHIALSYQLRRHMPQIAQRTFPQEGFTVYDSDDQVAAALQHAGFTPPEVRVFGDPAHPGGRVALATPAPGCQAKCGRAGALAAKAAPTGTAAGTFPARRDARDR
jgi:SAM-dependent methyltransferase